MSVQPLVWPEMIASSPVEFVLLEPRIEWTSGCWDAGTSCSPQSGP